MRHVLASASLVGAVAAAALFAAAGPGRAQERSRSGEELYAGKCVYCHAAGGWGTRTLAKRVPASEAVLTDRKNLPAQYVAYVVRNGVGAMPQFTPTDLTDEEVARLAQWLDEKN